MASLTGTKIKDTYDGLLKTTDNGALGASAKQITDGLGNSSGVYLGTSGNFGIGVVPTRTLQVHEASATSSAIKISNSTTGATVNDGFDLVVDSVGNAYLAQKEALPLIFLTSDTERMRITSGGSLLIGKIAESNAPAGLWLQKDASDGGQIRFGRQSGTATQAHLYFFNSGGGSVGSVTTTDSSTAYNTSSDYRLKEDWQPMADALTRIDALNPINFAWKFDGSRVDGFLAHELAEVIPEAVTGTKDAMRDEEYEVSPAVYEDVVHPAVDEVLDEEGNILTPAQEEWTEQVLVSEAVMGTRSVPDYQGIDQSKIVPLLVAAIQELKAEVDALKGA